MSITFFIAALVACCDADERNATVRNKADRDMQTIAPMPTLKSLFLLPSASLLQDD